MCTLFWTASEIGSECSSCNNSESENTAEMAKSSNRPTFAPARKPRRLPPVYRGGAGQPRYRGKNDSHSLPQIEISNGDAMYRVPPINAENWEEFSEVGISFSKATFLVNVWYFLDCWRNRKWI